MAKYLYLKRIRHIDSMPKTKNQLIAEAKERGLRVSQKLRKWMIEDLLQKDNALEEARAREVIIHHGETVYNQIIKRINKMDFFDELIIYYNPSDPRQIEDPDSVRTTTIEKVLGGVLYHCLIGAHLTTTFVPWKTLPSSLRADFNEGEVF